MLISVPNNPKQISNLRFPEFEGEWEVKKLGEISTFYSGGTPLTSKREYFDGDIPFIRSGEINSDKTEQFISELGLKNSSAKLVEVGDILYALYGATSGEVGICKLNGAINQAVLCNKSNENHYFLFSYLRDKKESITNTFLQGGQGNLSADIVKKIELYIPSIKEQTKISSFLSKIDERIQTQSKILIHLKSLIESLNDSLSEQKIRINSNFENWKKVRLGDLGYTFTGLSGKTKEDFGNGKRYIQYKQIFDSSKIVIENCGYVNVSENENQNSVKYGDIFFTISSETPDEIGMSSVLLEDVKNVYLNSFCFGFRLNSFNGLLPEFARFLFRSKIVRNEIKKLAQGSTRYNMSKIELLKLEILLPSIMEQKEIFSFLSSLDQKIQTEKAILEQLEMQKKYLLQQMFV